MRGRVSDLVSAALLLLTVGCGSQAASTPAPTPYPGALVQAVWQAKHDLSYPTGIALDSSGNVYVIDGGNQRVVKFDSGGAYLTAWGSSGKGDGQFGFWDGSAHFGGIAVDSTNHVLVADFTGRVQVFDSTGKFIRAWRTSERTISVFAMALDHAGDIYLAGGCQLTKFGPDGQNLGAWGSDTKCGSANGQFNQLDYVTVAPDGNIWTGEQLGERIQKFDSHMHFLSKLGSKGSGPGQYSHGIFGIVFDKKGRIWTVDNGGDRLEVYNSRMRFIGQWGHEGTGPGDFEFPSYMAIDAQGDLYVVETGGGRVQKLHPLV
jgi:DNA-binding beta-propeller fold protein YncE